MRYIPVITTLLILTLMGCQTTTQEIGSKQSAFFKDLSFVQVMKRATPAGVICSSPNPPGGGRTYAGNPESIAQWTVFNCQGKELTTSDQDAFMSLLKAELENEINRAGITAMGKDDQEGYFCLEYRTGNNHGWIEVIGKRAEGDSYRLLFVKRELRWQ